MTTESNNSLFVFNFSQVADSEDLSCLSILTPEQASFLTIDGFDSNLFNQLVTCNPKYEIFSIAHTGTNTTSL